MIRQFLLALLLTAVTVTIHAAGTVRIVLPFSGIWSGKAAGAAPMALMPLIRLVGALLLLHLIEIGIWAGVFAVVGLLPNFETSLYFSLTSYTTVGYGDVLLPVSWRLVGPIEAAVGVLMLGWSTSIMVAGLHRIYARLVDLQRPD